MIGYGWRYRKTLRKLRVLGVACEIACVACVAASTLAFAPPARAQSPDDSSADTLHKLNESVDSLIKKVSPSVVQILVTGYGPLEEGERSSTSVIIGRQRAIGSGFVIDPSGYIVTNAHVVNGAQRVRVVLPLMTNESSASAALYARVNNIAARGEGGARGRRVGHERKYHADALRAVYDMSVGDDIAAWIDDEAGANGALPPDNHTGATALALFERAIASD